MKLGTSAGAFGKQANVKPGASQRLALEVVVEEML